MCTTYLNFIFNFPHIFNVFSELHDVKDDSLLFMCFVLFSLSDEPKKRKENICFMFTLVFMLAYNKQVFGELEGKCYSKFWTHVIIANVWIDFLLFVIWYFYLDWLGNLVTFFLLFALLLLFLFVEKTLEVLFKSIFIIWFYNW